MLIPYQKCQSREEAYNQVKGNITEEKISKFKVKADLNYDETGKIVSANGKGFDLDIIFHEENCELDLKLSFLVKPFREKILSALRREVEKVI